MVLRLQEVELLLNPVAVFRHREFQLPWLRRWPLLKETSQVSNNQCIPTSAAIHKHQICRTHKAYRPSVCACYEVTHSYTHHYHYSWEDKLHSQVPLRPTGKFQVPIEWLWIGLRAGLDGFGEGKNLLLLPEIEPRTVQSLYDWAVRTTLEHHARQNCLRRCGKHMNGSDRYGWRRKTAWLEHIEDGALKLFKCTFPGFNL